MLTDIIRGVKHSLRIDRTIHTLVNDVQIYNICYILFVSNVIMNIIGTISEYIISKFSFLIFSWAFYFGWTLPYNILSLVMKVVLLSHLSMLINKRGPFSPLNPVNTTHDKDFLLKIRKMCKFYAEEIYRIIIFIPLEIQSILLWKLRLSWLAMLHEQFVYGLCFWEYRWNRDWATFNEKKTIWERRWPYFIGFGCTFGLLRYIFYIWIGNSQLAYGFYAHWMIAASYVADPIIDLVEGYRLPLLVIPTYLVSFTFIVTSFFSRLLLKRSL